MSVSPPKDGDVEPAATQSPDEERDMDRPDRPHAPEQNVPYEFEVKEQDRWLPIANVARIMKTALPDNAKIAKEAKECMQECVSEFISFITSEGTSDPSLFWFGIEVDWMLTFMKASEKCQQEKRKTVNGEDILFAMTSLGFENYAEALKIYLSKYRESQAARGEHQHRQGSGIAGNESIAGTGIQPQATSSSSTTAYHERSDNVNNILSPTGVDVPEHDPGGYGYSSVVGSGHNGGAGATY
ncbi:MAG: hypothetical protein M1816_006445 [Peltula sp. TS41687]|nr:MAG: hypothetical protein M1816_006445 [Peltula sp. TS41687]